MPHMTLGRKLGMTQIWDAEGNRVPITVVQVGPCVVTGIKSKDGKDGYDAVQLAFEQVTAKKVNKPVAGVFARANVEPHRYLREFRVTAEEAATYTVGQTFTTEFLKKDQVLDVVGTSKGRGFTGVMKRYNYSGSDAGHGTHEAFRNVGTGGQGSATPGRVPKGKRRPGQYGNARSTKQNILIQFVDPDNCLIYLKGGIAGPNGGMVELRESVKTPDA